MLCKCSRVPILALGYVQYDKFLSSTSSQRHVTVDQHSLCRCINSLGLAEYALNSMIPTATRKKQATRKRLGMHVLLIEVERRNSEGKVPSTLGRERESR
jgi:hypothetical protein